MNKLVDFILGSTKCQNCGYQLDEHSNFCSNCGNEIGILQKNGDDWKFGGSHFRLIILIFGICSVLITVFMKYFL